MAETCPLRDWVSSSDPRYRPSLGSGVTYSGKAPVFTYRWLTPDYPL